MKLKKNLLVAVLLVLVQSNCFSQKPGAAIVRIDDGLNTRCINRNSDAIQIGFAGMKIDKKKNWFKNQSQAGVQIGIQVEGMDDQYNIKATEMTRLYVVDVKEYDSGSILLPIEGSVINYFPLQNKGTFYNGINLSVTLIQKKDNTSFGIVVKELVNMTKQFPFPTTPFDPGIKMLADFTTKLISPSNDDENKINRIPTSTINLPFSPNGQCDQNSFQEKTGVFSVIFGNETVSEDYVDINKLSDYVFKLQTSPSRMILYCKKDSKGKCTGDFKSIKNDFLLFYINAFPLNPTSPKTSITVTPNTGTNIEAYTLQGKLKESSWFQMANADFQNKIVSASSAFQYESNNNTKTYTTELFNSDALILDYLEASRRLINLGLSGEVNNLPSLPKYIIKN